MVTVRTNNERYYKIFKRISSNAFVLALQEDMGISNLFNIEDLALCQGHDEDEPNDAIVCKLLPAPCVQEEIEDVIDHQLMSTNGSGHQTYLIKWNGCLLFYCTWITDSKFQRLNPNFMPLTR
jgi:hypothetical protein